VKIGELEKSVLDTSLSEAQEGLRVDLACGTNLRPGYVGVDSIPLDELVRMTEGFKGEAPPEYEGYVQHDLYDIPWPFEDSSIAAAYSSHFVEHIPHYHPDWGAGRDGWWVWFEELYRVMEDGGIVEIIHPFSRSDRAFWDPTHTRYIHYQTWFYLNREHRLNLGVNHYAPEVDFEVMNIQAIHEPTMLDGKSDDVVNFARQFYFNPTDDLFVVLKVNK